MVIRLYMDVHVPMAITRQLRLRGVDVVTANEEGTNRLPDDALLELASKEGRVVFTHEFALRRWQKIGNGLPGRFAV